MILMIDNYDSFTYNLVQYLGQLGEEVVVHRNDEITLDQIEGLNPDAIFLSPGPGSPEGAGITVDVIKRFHTAIPLMGIRLRRRCCQGRQTDARQDLRGHQRREDNLQGAPQSL